MRVINIKKPVVKLVACYLHKEGRSIRYIADKLGHDKTTINRWITDEKKVHKEVDLLLTQKLFKIYITRESEWNL